MADIEPRLIDLELRYMKIERELLQLSDVVAAQQRVIEALTLEAKRRRDQQYQGERERERDEPALGDERPPHY